MRLIIIMAISACYLLSCKQNAVEQNKAIPNVSQERLVKLNQYFLKNEKASIKAYILRRKWNMTQTESGLWYEILDKGNGEIIKDLQKLKMKYMLELLDGTFCYSSDSTGIKEISPGTGTTETGLDEGLQLISFGGKARFILPAHLAHGVSGDGKCIPPRTAIVYQVEILSN